MYLTQEEIERIVRHYKPTDAAARAHSAVRGAVKDTLERFVFRLPECPEGHVALEKLQEALFWANAAIARNHGALEADSPEELMRPESATEVSARLRRVARGEEPPRPTDPGVEFAVLPGREASPAREDQSVSVPAGTMTTHEES